MDGTVARPRPLLALGLRLLAALTLATMAMLVKLGAQRGVHLAEMLFWRQAVTLLIVTALLGALGRLAQVRTGRLRAHGMRAIYGIVGMVFVYGAVILLPLAEATTLSFTTPIFAVLLAIALFRERIGLYRWSAVVIGFLGVLIVMQPGSGDTIDPFGIAAGLVAAFMVALISLQIQDLNTTETPFSIIFWFTALTAPVVALALPFVFTAHDATTWLVLFAMAVCGAAAQVLLTLSLRFGSAATIIVMDYTALVWAVAYGWTVFDTQPPPALWVGAPLIIAAGLLVAWREHFLRRGRAATEP